MRRRMPRRRAHRGTLQNLGDAIAEDIALELAAGVARRRVSRRAAWQADGGSRSMP
jgi:hypothetical protein